MTCSKGASTSSATMSTRGTITSAAVCSCSFTMLARIARSCGSIGSSCSSISSSSEARKSCSPARSPRSCFSQLRKPRNGPSSASRAPGGRPVGASVITHRLPLGIGVGDPEPRQHLGLQRLHLLGLAGLFMTVAEEVQNSVYNKVTQMVGQILALLLCLSTHGLVGQNDVAQQERRLGW